MKQIQPERLETNWVLWILLSHTRDILLRVMMKNLRSFHVYPMEAGVLFIVHESVPPAPTPADISRWMFRETQTVSGLLKRMERRGLIRKVKDDKRKNGIRIVPTRRGTEIYKRTVGREGITNVLASLPGEGHQQLIKYLEQLRQEGLKQLKIKDIYFSHRGK
jgi:DNA-binding MarR family transcriptional regulator